MKSANIDQVVNKIPETLRLPFSVWSKMGLFSGHKFKRYFPMAILTLSLANLIVIAMVQYINIKKDVSDFVRNLEEIFSFTQMLGKAVVVTYRIDDFRQLIEMSKLFWNPNKCSQQTATKLSSIYGLILRLQKAYLLFLVMSGVVVIVVPLLEKAPPMGIWTLEGHDKLYYFVTIEQIVTIPCAEIFLLGLDCMYLGFCAEIVVQFKILYQYLEELTAEGNSLDEMEVNYLNKIKTCIRHHQLVLWFIKKFRQTFSLILLIQYITVCPLVCAELFAAFEGREYQMKGRHSVLFLAVTLQLSFYCISANYVADEALTVSNAVYFSKWYSHHFPSLKVPLLLMMQNAQNGIVIKAGGLVHINTQTFVNVLKVGWSACCLMRGLRKE